MWRHSLPDNKSYDLITGGAGFVGSHLARYLIGMGRSVRILDDLSTGQLSNLGDLNSKIDFLQGSILDDALVNKATKGVQTVYHLAAIASVQRSIENPQLSHEVCATGTLKVLDHARTNGCRRLVFAASSSAYGNCTTPVQCEDSPVIPMSPYAAAKLAGEAYCQAFALGMNFETVRLRFFNIYGPNQRSDSPYSGVIAIFANAFKAGKIPTIHGDGLQSRDFVHVSDAVQALWLAGTSSKVSGQVFNIGTGTSTSLLDLVSYLKTILGSSLSVQHGPARAGDVRHSLANIEKARNLLGFNPKMPVKDGLANLLS